MLQRLDYLFTVSRGWGGWAGLLIIRAGLQIPEGGKLMLYWALVFLVVAIIAGVLGFTGIAVAAAGIAKILFVVFLILFLISIIMHVGRRGTV